MVVQCCSSICWLLISLVISLWWLLTWKKKHGKTMVNGVDSPRNQVTRSCVFRSAMRGSRLTNWSHSLDGPTETLWPWESPVWPALLQRCTLGTKTHEKESFNHPNIGCTPEQARFWVPIVQICKRMSYNFNPVLMIRYRYPLVN